MRHTRATTLSCADYIGLYGILAFTAGKLRTDLKKAPGLTATLQCGYRSLQSLRSSVTSVSCNHIGVMGLASKLLQGSRNPRNRNVPEHLLASASASALHEQLQIGRYPRSVLLIEMGICLQARCCLPCWEVSKRGPRSIVLVSRSPSQ